MQHLPIWPAKQGGASVALGLEQWDSRLVWAAFLCLYQVSALHLRLSVFTVV